MFESVYPGINIETALVPWYISSERETVWESGGNPDNIPEYDWQCPEIEEI